ncbi:NAD-dependent epimerase/dehydratase family protein [Cryobacterium sp. Hb1]|uniref:NAD-dependent epimerase/dehydratase family protein n=1 Tax=Cryobacterium sp. Hb1 TaxID=1259147 RepID=UPI00106BFF11|nr:NAD-dependent epimerase/dehydratase family protein [Cryobacterium sp. Hb1]
MTAVGWVAVSSALVISLGLPTILNPLLRKHGIFDLPSHRSSHDAVALRGAGLSPLVAFGVAFLICILASWTGAPVLGIVLVASLLIGLIGFLEDVQGLRVWVRATAQLAIGGTATGALLTTTETSLWWMPVGAIFFASYTNAANFMDGIDGISGFHGTIVGIAFGVIGMISGVGWLVPAGLILSASFLGFVPWNVFNKGVFLGDVGSYLLGGAISLFVIGAVLSGVSPVALAGPLIIYLADSGMTLVGRVLRGERWNQPHRLHIYQVLVDAGHSHVSISTLVAAASAVTAALGIVATFGPAHLSVVALGLGVVVVILYLAIPKLIKIYPRQSDGNGRLERSLIGSSSLSRPATKWLIFGATGFVGTAIVSELKARGFQVAVAAGPRLKLNPSASAEEALSQLRDYADVLKGLVPLMREADVVVNAAGLAQPDSGGGDELFGANALLPSLLLTASQEAQVQRFVHLSSCAVQGRQRILDESPSVFPFSPYSHAKALGELMICAHPASSLAVIIRATSVQGPGRPTTRRLQRMAQSPFASVAGAGTNSTVVSSVGGLAAFVAYVGSFERSVPAIVLQPWEGLTTGSLLQLAGGHPPRHYPILLCRALVGIGYAVGRVVKPANGLVRRIDLMWFGQAQDSRWAREEGLEGEPRMDAAFRLPAPQ